MVVMARVLLGVTGGVAAYKAAELARLLVKAGHEVTPILTDEAETFVTAKTFEALARREAAHELYPHLVAADVQAGNAQVIENFANAMQYLTQRRLGFLLIRLAPEQAAQPLARLGGLRTERQIGQ